MTQRRQNEDLDELARRRALTEDAARPDQVAARHAAGRRTARENIADLIDPGSFVEYGRLATAAQERRLDEEALLARTPADGLIGGLARINSDLVGRQRSSCGVLSYDYLVMAGTQGMRGHHKSDRLLAVIERLRLPTVFYAEGGGGRPNDTDYPVVSALDVGSFALWARLSGRCPRVAVVAGYCFAGNAVLAASADLLVATADASLGVAGPAMVVGAGLGDHAAEDIGPAPMLARNGVVDVLVADEAEATDVARRLVGYFQGRTEPGPAADQALLRDALPEREREAYDVTPIVELLCDVDSVTFLREAFAPELVTALGRIDGRPVGLIANQTTAMAGSVTAAGSDKAARFIQLCDAFGLPVIALVDTPGILAGPDAERTAILRHASRLLVAGSTVGVPLIGVVLRRGYGLGAQAMLGGSTREPLLTLAWPSAHMGPMGIEGAVRLAMRRELEALNEPERTQRYTDAVAAYRDRVSVRNVARAFEIDDVIDPAETRAVIAATLDAAAGPDDAFVASGRTVDTW